MSKLLSLPPHEVHIWLAYYDEINDEQLLGTYRQILNDAERRQEPRFYFPRDRRRYLVTRAMARVVLSRYAAVRPADWIFTHNQYGRPEIANADVAHRQLSFNISHTHSLIALGVVRSRSLGVDVENVVAREASLGIADRYFSSSETTALYAAPHTRRPFRFFEYWTFKESYIKARGMGLSLALDKFSFHFPSDRAVSFEVDPELGDDATRWKFWQFQPASQYLAAVCTELLSAHQEHMVIRQIVPLVSEQVLALNYCRTS